jgi:hypothetical protein
MFIDIFAEERNSEAVVEPYFKLTGEEHLKLLYKFIWYRLQSPTIEDFGKRFFTELCDTQF